MDRVCIYCNQPITDDETFGVNYEEEDIYYFHTQCYIWSTDAKSTTAGNN